MASVRASVMTQAQAAARRLGAVPEDPASAPCVEQLVRCAQLSQDAEHTLDWALATLHAHATVATDEVACQLLRAARARISRPPKDTAATSTGPAQTLAWL